MSKRWVWIAVSGMLLALAGSTAFAGQNHCTTLQEGRLLYGAGHYLEGEAVPVGENDYGYNYQAHVFDGSYFNVYAGREGLPPWDGDDDAYLAEHPDAADHWAWPLRHVHLQMKWNDAWLSNKDCDGDGLLDRHRGHASYLGSGAWLTNRESSMERRQRWRSFAKIVAAPADGTASGGTWYTADAREIGPVIWQLFAVVQHVVGGQGAQIVSPAGPGFGKWQP